MEEDAQMLVGKRQGPRSRSEDTESTSSDDSVRCERGGWESYQYTVHRAIVSVSISK